MRIARSRGGDVALDPGARLPGRGAYLHRRTECLEAATARGALSRALRTPLRPDDLATLREAIRKEIDRT